jgi:signal transduction histidine kinase
MRSLFIKIFIWFWLTMALASIALFLSTELTRPQPFSPPLRDAASGIFSMYAQVAVDTLESRGPTALASYMDQIGRAARIRSELFNDRGEEVSGTDTIHGARELAQQTFSSVRKESLASTGRPRLISRAATGGTGSRYVLIVEGAGGPFETGYKPQVLRLLAFLLTSGVLCYLLARYLTSPVAKLRAMTHTLASGDLSARVGPSLGRRRDELADLGRDFDVMVERIESLVAAQRRLLGDISHELRSPLARLSVALGLARRKAGKEVGTELDRIEREAEIINELIGQMLTLTRLESRSEGIKKVEFDLAALVCQIADDADFEACEKQCRVSTVHVDECMAIGSVELLHSAIENVLRNAVQFTPAGTAIDVSLLRISEGDRNYALITVRDHGRGLPEGALEDIFKPFYRVADARDRESGGTGLGLAITDRAIRLHGGTAAASNAEGGGLLVELWLPLGESHAKPAVKPPDGPSSRPDNVTINETSTRAHRRVRTVIDAES